MDARPWLDVVSTGIPRLTTERCIRSWLNNFTDRDKFQLRWLFHLDVFPRLAQHADQNMTMAETVAPLFDQAVTLRTQPGRGYGNALHTMLRHCRHDVLWIEDDKLWHAPFTVGDLIGDKPKFWPGSVDRHWPVSLPFATSPGYWPMNYWQWLLENFPDKPEQVTESALMGLCELMGKSGDFVSEQGSYWEDVGHAAARELSFKYRVGPHLIPDLTGGLGRVANRIHALWLCLSPAHHLHESVEIKMMEKWGKDWSWRAPVAKVNHAFTLIDLLRGHFGDRPLVGVEVGVHQGNCSSRLLRRMPKLVMHLVDSWRGWEELSSYRKTTDLVSTYSDEDQIKVWKTARAQLVGQWGTDRARMWVADSLALARRFAEQGKRFDFVFIDADHSFDGVSADVRAWWPLVRDGGLLCGHDYGIGKGHNFGTQVKAAVDGWAATGRCVEVLPDWVWVVRKPTGGELPAWRFA